MSYDPNSELIQWDDARFDCRDMEDNIDKSAQEQPNYHPELQDAQYLAVVNVILTGTINLWVQAK